MDEKTQEFKSSLISSLLENNRDKLETSAFKRLGRTGLAMLKSGMMISAKKKHTEGEYNIDPRKLSKIVSSVGELKGIAMKMGQIMSYIDMAIPSELQDALSVLQTHAQPMSFEKVKQIISDELHENAAPLLENIGETPVSAASIGQVHKSLLPDGTPVAVKIQYPEIMHAIESDFRPAAIGTKMASFFFPGAHVDQFIEEARERFLEECNYAHEARCQQRFFELYRNHEILFVPEVHFDFSSQRVLTTTFVNGMTFEAFLATNPSQDIRNKIGESLFEFYIGTLFENQLYNCDPHPGNYIFCPDGRIAMLDHGCCREFDYDFVTKLSQLTKAVHSDKQEEIHNALIALGMIGEGKSYDYPTIRKFLRSFYGPMLVDQVTPVDLGAAMEMRGVFKAKQKLLKFALPAEFMFLFRIRFGLMSVLARLDARANWYQLERQYLI